MKNFNMSCDPCEFLTTIVRNKNSVLVRDSLKEREI